MRSPIAATLVALCLQSFTAAMPAVMSSVDGKTTLVDRGFNGMGLATLWVAVREYMQGQASASLHIVSIIAHVLTT
jgi:hypothetical protein